MATHIHEIEPHELEDAVEPGECTLVLAPPGSELSHYPDPPDSVRRHYPTPSGTGKCHPLQALGRVVPRLTDIEAFDDDELVVVDDFVTAAVELDDDEWATHLDECAEESLFSRPGGTVLVTRPRSFDWLCRYDVRVGLQSIDRLDTILLVRTPPPMFADAVEAFHVFLDGPFDGPERDDRLLELVDHVTYPAYEFETDALRLELGRYDTTVAPTELLAESVNGAEPPLGAADVRRTLVSEAPDLSPFLETTAEAASALVPDVPPFAALSNADSPQARAATALVATAVRDDAWSLSPLTDRPLTPVSAEGLEDGFGLPPGTIDHLRIYASPAGRVQISDRLASDPDSLAVIDAAVNEHVDVLEDTRELIDRLDRSVADSDRVMPDPSPSWQCDGLERVREAVAARNGPDSPELDVMVTRLDDGTRAGADDIVAAVANGVVVLTGPSGTGKRALVAQVATTLSEWGANVGHLQGMPAGDRPWIDVTAEIVLIATYLDEPGRVSTVHEIEALVEWVEEGVCSGALVCCDETDFEQFQSVSEQAGCDAYRAWTDRSEFLTETPNASVERSPAAVATDLLDALGWEENPNPNLSGVSGPQGISPIATIAGVPDHVLTAEFVGEVLAATVTHVGATHRPDAVEPWLDRVDSLVRRVGQYRSSDASESVVFQGGVYGTAMASIAIAEPRNEEWVGAIDRLARTATHATGGTRHGTMPPIGDPLSPLDEAYATALSTLAASEDGSIANSAALACVDQFLLSTTTAIPGKGSVHVLSIVYGKTVVRVIEDTPDEASADRALTSLEELIRQSVAEYDQSEMTVSLGNVCGGVLAALSTLECSRDDLLEWVRTVDDRAMASIDSFGTYVDVQGAITLAYGSALSVWIFDYDPSLEAFGHWIDAVAECMIRTAVRADHQDVHDTFVDHRDVHDTFVDHRNDSDPEAGHGDDPDSRLCRWYTAAVKHAVSNGEEDPAVVFAGHARLATTLARSDVHGESADAFLATLHASALSELAVVDRQTQPHQPVTGQFDPTASFDEWVETYTAAIGHSVTIDPDRSPGQNEDADTPRTHLEVSSNRWGDEGPDLTEIFTPTDHRVTLGTRSGTTADGDTPTSPQEYVTAVYRDALSTNLVARAKRDGVHVRPRREVAWFGLVTDAVADLAGDDRVVDDPVSFVADVYGGAAVNWARNGGTELAEEWIGTLLYMLTEARSALDPTDRDAVFDRSASMSAVLFDTLLCRADLGSQGHAHLLETVCSHVEAAATTSDNPRPPADHRRAVATSTLTLAADAPIDELRFRVEEATSIVDTLVDPDGEHVAADHRRSDGVAERDRVFASAIEWVGSNRGSVSHPDAWLSEVCGHLGEPATVAESIEPVIGVYTRIIGAAFRDEDDDWRRTLESHLRDTAASCGEDPDRVIDRVYEDARTRSS